MAFPTWGVETVFGFSLPNGAAAKVVLHLEKSPHADPSQADLDAIAAAGKAWWETAHSPAPAAKGDFSSGVTLQSVTTTARGLSPQLQSVAVSGVAGTQSGNALPPESSVVTTWYTGTPGRSYRGRSFWPMLVYGALGANGELTTSSITGYTQLYTTLRTLLEGAATGYLLSVYSAKLGVLTPVNASSPLVRPIIHHQRRRNA